MRSWINSIILHRITFLKSITILDCPEFHMLLCLLHNDLKNCYPLLHNDLFLFGGIWVIWRAVRLMEVEMMGQGVMYGWI